MMATAFAFEVLMPRNEISSAMDPDSSIIRTKAVRWLRVTLWLYIFSVLNNRFLVYRPRTVRKSAMRSSIESQSRP